MTRFKVKDLMIDVLPAKQEVPDLEALCWRFTCYNIITRDCYRFFSPCWNFRTCFNYITPDCIPYITPRHCYPHYITPCHRYFTPICQQHISEFPCPGNTELVACPGDSRFDPELPFDPRELGILREQLRASLEQVEAAEKRVAEQMAPQTLEEVELLRGKLEEAMAELDELAKGMK